MQPVAWPPGHWMPPSLPTLPPRCAPQAWSCVAATKALLTRINDAARIWLTQTRHHSHYVIRVVVGQFDAAREDVMMVATVVRDLVG